MAKTFVWEEDLLDPDRADLRDGGGTFLGRVARKRDRWFAYRAGEEEGFFHSGSKTVSQAALIREITRAGGAS